MNRYSMTSKLLKSRINKIGFILLSLSLIAIMSGCSVTYKAVATSSDFDEALIGTVRHNLLAGSASFKFKGRESGFSCEGIGERAYYIPSNFTCEGQRGRGFGSCSDGRTLKFEWVADSCTLTYGKGEDSLGNSFYFTAGMNDDEFKEYINNVAKWYERRRSQGIYQEEARNQKKMKMTDNNLELTLLNDKQWSMDINVMRI